MSERFDSLMYHSGLTAQGCWDEMDSYQHEAIMKFAELIVKDCISIVENSSKAHAHTTYDKDVIDSTIIRCINNIKREFNV